MVLFLDFDGVLHPEQATAEQLINQNGSPNAMICFRAAQNSSPELAEMANCG